MKKLLLASALLAGLTCVAHAAAVDTAAGQSAANAAAQQRRNLPLGTLSASDLLAVRQYEIIGPLGGMAGLPEPEVILMLLAGLGLIGYRAKSHSNEKIR